MCDFGVAIRQRDFHFNEAHTHLNHGSYGAVPRPVHQERLKLMAEQEESPDVWFRWTSPRMWKESRQAVADFLSTDVDNVVLVQNATTACNAVVKSLNFEPGESILVNTYTYKAVANACEAVMDKSDGKLLTAELPLELDKSALMELYKEKLENNPEIKLVVLDLISSCSAIRYPLEELIALCKEYDKLVLVDGAHGPGHVSINLSTLGAHFFTGNFHKWLYTPRGCAVLWVHPDFHGVVKPSVTSHGYNSGSLQGDYFWLGTTDNTPFFTVSKAIQYHQNVGGLEKIHAYCTDLLDRAVDMLTESWQTQRFPIPREMEAPFMRVIEVPAIQAHQVNESAEFQFYDMPWLIEELTHTHNITAVCYCMHGRNWMRLSANIYNCMADYERLRDAVLLLINREK